MPVEWSERIRALNRLSDLLKEQKSSALSVELDALLQNAGSQDAAAQAEALVMNNPAAAALYASLLEELHALFDPSPGKPPLTDGVLVVCPQETPHQFKEITDARNIPNCPVCGLPMRLVEQGV